MTDNPIISKAVSARYEDETCSSIWVEWVSPDDGKLRTHSIPADPSNSDYQDLLAEGWDEAAFQKQTEAWKRQSVKDMNMMIRIAAEELAEEAIEARVAAKMQVWERKLAELDERDAISKENFEKVKKSIEAAEGRILDADLKVKAASVAVDNKFWDALFEANENKDEVFKFKLWALEQDIFKEASNENKKELRKQATVFDCITYMNTLINN